MVASERVHRLERRLQGVAFLVVVALLLGLTIAIYNKALPWQASDQVTLQADRIGNQLVVPADVKLNGILVGRVSGVHVSGDHAVMTLQIDPSKMKLIPADVQARILPKTLFGEKFVDLVRPASPSTVTFADLHSRGQRIVIDQDHSQTAIELQTVFNDLVPLLKTLNPADLSVTLSNVAEAVRNRGDALGHNFELIDTFFTRFNKDLPTFDHDISALATMASNYADAAPDLLATLHNFTVNAKTLTEKQDVFAQFLTGTSGFARTATRVLGDNANRLITLANVSKPVADLYAKYSIVLECLPNGLAIYDRTRLEPAFGPGPYLHISLTPVGDRGAYTPADRPLKSDLTSLTLPANCYGLPYGSHKLNPVFTAYPGPHPSGNAACAGTTAPPTCPAAPPAQGAASAQGTSAAGANPADFAGAVGSPAEQELVGGLFPSLATGRGAGLTDLLLGPMLRGMTVQASA